ncbi:hypothetical protein AOG1_09830 [Geobacter sp. AOG1]|nr:hypothetical protein AOG1_09830 [Geobacter sp. AOG1]
MAAIKRSRNCPLEIYLKAGTEGNPEYFSKRLSF